MRPARHLLQGAGLALLLIALSGAVLLIVNQGGEGEACRVAPSVAAFGCFLRRYPEIAAGLIATSGAIFAAWVAWMAVQQQIEQAAAKEREARLIMRGLLADEILPTVNQIWRALDRTIHSADDEQLTRDRRLTAHEALRHLPDPAALQRLEALSGEVNPVDREKIRPVLVGLDHLHRRHAQGCVMTDPLKEAAYFLGFREILSRMLAFLREFDAEMARVFAGRELAFVDPTPIATRLVELIDKTDQGYWADP